VHVNAALAWSDINKSNLTPEILDIDGMAGSKTRHFYNNMCSLILPDRRTTYLEVGVLIGSSFISALYGNEHVHGVAIDNWSEFGGGKDEFHANLANFLPGVTPLVLEKDCFAVDTQSELTQGKVDIFVYDGGHSFEEQLAAIVHFWSCLADQSVIIIDDWNWDEVQVGTLEGLHTVHANVVLQREIRTEYNGDRDGYWNGMAVFVIDKSV